MDLDPTDVHMHDGDVLDSTEPNGGFAPSPDGSLLKPEDRASFWSRPREASAEKKSAEPAPLKGAGVKREGDVFDFALTKRKDAPRPPKFTPLPYASSQTGLVYDARMRFHVEAIAEENDIHPEDPRRIHAIFTSFVDAGLAWKEGTVAPSLEYYMARIDARKVTKEEVCLVHTEKHWDWIQTLETLSPEELQEERQHADQVFMDSVYLSPMTPFCAALSAGGAIEACRAVMLGKVKNVFAVIRPPGHHAEREDAKGFCFYDNVSIATKVCQREFGEDCRKVMVLDWDVHHGNGIQQANYDDPNVLYMSLHVHENGRFYPECSYRDKRPPYGDHLHCGTGAGLGKNVNVPWSRKGMGDADYIYAFQQVIMPIATEFNPDLVIIAAGFDAAEGDMLGGCKVTPAGYAHMTHMLMSLADGKVVACLEGGYNLESIARSATAVTRTLMGEPPERLETLDPTVSGVNDVKLVLRQQSRFWTSLYPKDDSARLRGELHGERMHDIIRTWQAETMWKKYGMTPLFVYKEQLSKSFENQVLATPNYMSARPLLVILHDPPDMQTSADPRTGKTDLHNSWLTDNVKTYIDWAVHHRFAVIDVNLPKHITADDSDGDSHEHQATDSVEHRTKEAQALLTYLWDNYIELARATHVFLLGTNTGHGAIINFIKTHEEAATERVTAAISFVADVPLQSCKSATNDDLAPWYYAHSMVFVQPEHNFWFSDLSRKPKKRFGRVGKTEAEEWTEMLVERREAVCQLLLRESRGWEELAGDEDEDEDEDGEAMVDISSGGDGAAGPTSPRQGQQFPPVGNFALSPRPKSSGMRSPPPVGGVVSPRGRQSGTPREGSPAKGSVGAFGASSR